VVPSRPLRASLALTLIALTPGEIPLYLNMSVRLRAIAALLALLTLPGCGEDDPTSPNAPAVNIATPLTGAMYTEGVAVEFTGSATDPQDGALLDAQLVWTSSIDGDLGTGPSVDVSAPSLGVHTVTLTATDSDGNTGSASVSISVAELAFIDGTVSSPEIGVVVNSTANALRLFQVGDPTDFREIPLGASSAVTSTGISVRGDRGIVPLGNAASVAVLDMRSQQIMSYYLFDSGNATGSAFVDNETVLAANQTTDEVGRFTIGQADNAISATMSVTQFPNDVIVVSDSLALVVSANLDDAYAPSGEGVVTAIDPRTMTLVDTVRTGGTNPQFGSLGPDGLLYVVNTGDYVNPSSLVIIDPTTMSQVDVVPGFPAGSGDVHVGANGHVFVSAFFVGTVVWDSNTGEFIRDIGDPLCAPLAGGGCRGAFSATTGADGSVYQAFFGSASDGLDPWIFRYSPDALALTDSIASGLGPVAVEVHSFRN
jgi:hypothetical protein